MKTFAFVVYILTANGHDQRVVLDSGLTARECAHRMTEAVQAVRVDTIVLVSCEEEQEV